MKSWLQPRPFTPGECLSKKLFSKTRLILTPVNLKTDETTKT
ncbi:hypothetical protein GGR27_002554 [Lewinella antarctica]|uniref:Uncharacterized protein n=1 Tax=Neolewinella antarctica TaxID=442734 RepID=A0ABX0XCN0_9BACT|nr:hypothetical protein [Neolewinella antarctica]